MSAKLSELEREEIISRVKRFQNQNKGYTQARLAKMANYTDGVISQVLGGTYNKGSTDLVLIALESVIEQESARLAVAVNTEFVEHNVAGQILTVGHIVNRSCTMGAVYGRPGIGKTLTSKAMAARYTGAIRLEVNVGSASPTHLYQALAKLVLKRYRGRGMHSMAACFRELVDTLRGSKRLLIFDEAENLPMASLNGIRQLHDATQCPVLLIGRPSLRENLRNTVKDRRMGGALLSRIFIERQVDEGDAGPDGGPSKPLFTVKEILQMIARFEVRLSREGAKWLCALANLIQLDDTDHGRGLRYAMYLFELTVQCKPNEAEITREILEQVNRELKDRDYAALVEVEIDSWLERHAKLA